MQWPIIYLSLEPFYSQLKPHRSVLSCGRYPPSYKSRHHKAEFIYFNTSLCDYTITPVTRCINNNKAIAPAAHRSLYSPLPTKCLCNKCQTVKIKNQP